MQSGELQLNSMLALVPSLSVQVALVSKDLELGAGQDISLVSNPPHTL